MRATDLFCSPADESGSGQPVGMDLCRAPGGELYVEGETWNLDECTQCTCRKGRVLCDTEVCPPALCPSPVKQKGACCHACSGKQWVDRITRFLGSRAVCTRTRNLSWRAGARGSGSRGGNGRF